jgi:hypothetical protein
VRQVFKNLERRNQIVVARKAAFEQMGVRWRCMVVDRPLHQDHDHVTNGKVGHLRHQNRIWFTTEGSLQRLVRMHDSLKRAAQHRYPNRISLNARRPREAMSVPEFAMNRSSYTQST